MFECNAREMEKLLNRCAKVFGAKELERLRGSPPRWSGFTTALGVAIKSSNNDLLNVSDEQIAGAAEIALEIWPFEAELVTNHFFEGGAK